VTSEKPATEVGAQPERPALSIAPAANVLQFRQATASEGKPPALSPGERKAFRELAQELTARLRGTPDAPAVAENKIDGAAVEEPQAPSQTAGVPVLPSSVPEPAGHGEIEASLINDDNAATAHQLAAPVIDPSLLDRMPIGVLIYRHDALIYANRHFLEWTGYDSLDSLTAAGGLNSLFVEPSTGVLSGSTAAQSLSIMTRQGADPDQRFSSRTPAFGGRCARRR
jgi:hypothetical protein